MSTSKVLWNTDITRLVFLAHSTTCYARNIRRKLNNITIENYVNNSDCIQHTTDQNETFTSATTRFQGSSILIIISVQVMQYSFH